MNNFILPVTIESRKIIFLDLEPTTEEHSLLSDTNEDVYIITIPPQGENEIFSISKSKTLQSLDSRYSDRRIDRLYFSYSYDKTAKLFEVSIKDEDGDQPIPPDDILCNGLFFSLENDDETITAKLKRNPYFKEPEQDHFFVRFTYIISESKYPYSAPLKFFISEQTNIMFAGLDFGSEASQMRQGQYGRISQNKIENSPVNLFQAVKSHSNEKAENSLYQQFEKDSYFFKSTFYANKILNAGSSNSFFDRYGLYNLADSIDIITKTADSNNEQFLESRVQIPNLKIIHGNTAFANQISFKLTSNGDSTTKTLSTLKDSIYAGLIRKLINAFIKTHISQPVYLHFTLLVPNIYTIQEILLIKGIVRKIIEESDDKRMITGVEISNLSESDAAFLGCTVREPVEPGNYYIIVDCGKGTTDFSIIQADKNDRSILKPVYRNGFAGAGNLISYAFFQSIIHFLNFLDPTNEVYNRNLGKFLTTHLDTISMSDFRYRLFDKIEEWKKNYHPETSKSSVEENWLSATNGTDNVVQWFSRTSIPSPFEIVQILEKISYIYDWNGYLEKCTSEIASRVASNLEQVVLHMNRKSKCGGILLTGRGFAFIPLKQAVLAGIKSIKGMGTIREINTSGISLKGICMDGIFTKNIITYSDISSTPFESKKGELRQITKRDIQVKGFFKKLWTIFNQIRTKIAGYDDSEYYDEDSNELMVINKDDIQNCQFFSSGKLYQPPKVSTKGIQSAKLILSRKGIYLRITEENEKVKTYLLNEIDNTSEDINLDRTFIIKSLFPGIIDRSLIS